MKNKRIVFFDGPCGLCNKFIGFLIKRDHAKHFHYAPLQGETAKELIEVKSESDESFALIYHDGADSHEASDAVIEIMDTLGGIWRVLSWSRVVPTSWRNAIYFLVARRRFKIFGKVEACSLNGRPPGDRLLP